MTTLDYVLLALVMIGALIDLARAVFLALFAPDDLGEDYRNDER